MSTPSYSDCGISVCYKDVQRFNPTTLTFNYERNSSAAFCKLLNRSGLRINPRNSTVIVLKPNLDAQEGFSHVCNER
jgi:hypothetical protein